MSNYNDGLWHGWNGGECPVHPETVVEVLWDDVSGPKRQKGKPGDFIWMGSKYVTLAFRVIKERREPREVWLIDGGSIGRIESHAGAPGAVLFREVLE